MKSSMLLDRIVADENGYLRTETAIKEGISRTVLAAYVRRNQMERVAQGLYLSSDAWPDELYQISTTNCRAIYSHETALFLHELMEREPLGISVTVPYGYNASHLRQQGIRVYQASPKIYALGKGTIKTNLEHEVNCYDIDRTICDCIRQKENLDVQVFQYALREYAIRPDKNLTNLMVYAKQLRIEKAVRTYTEVLL